MIDGLYDFNIQTPMGNLNALVKLVTNNSELNGYIDVMGKKSEFKNGIVRGNQIFLKGKISSGFANIEYDISGQLQEKTLFLNAKTNLGNFNLQGKKRTVT